MRQPIFVHGTIVGLTIVIVNTINLEFGRGQVWLGLLVMFIAFSAIFIAVRQYRDKTLGGVITFWRALFLGLGVTAVASVVYVAVWEAYLAVTDYQFIQEYADLAATAAEAEKFTAQYSNPLFRLPVTFVEVFPAGFLVSLISALVLRSQRGRGKRQAPRQSNE